MDCKIILKCRVCLGEFDEQSMHELFRGKATDKDEMQTLKLNEKVEYCCGVMIRKSPEMPTKICEKCFDMTRMWFSFRDMCINTQVYLESMCNDRVRPPEVADNESDYLEYLLEDLQTFRVKTHADFTITTDAYSETENDLYIEEELMIAESDSEFKNIRKNSNSEEQNETIDTVYFEDEDPTPPRHNEKQTKKKTAPLCPKKYFRPPSPSSYMCSICGNVYTKKSSFRYHMSLHDNVKPHECELCDKQFRQICELKNHMRRHTGERPFKCAYCDRHFIDRSEKHRHERVHTNIRPYVCRVCDKSFMYSAILKNHIKLHSGEKEFKCLVCQKSFTLPHQLKAHLQTITHKQREAQFVPAGYEAVYE